MSFLSSGIVLASAMAICLQDHPQQVMAPSLKYAVAGEVATGEVVRESAGELSLDTRPCDPEPTIVVFRDPFTREPAGTIECPRTVKNLVQALKK